MVTNGRETTRELLERIERENKAAEAAARREHEEALLAEVTRLRAEVAKLTTPPPLVRSKMSPAAKSAYIRTKGLASYQRLDWA